MNACLTREYFLAPKLNPAMGWKPWPMPSTALKMNIVILLEMLIAAIAASP